MPNTLRRPMFRGGPVNSEGTGITSGLDQGYATGGRVGLRDGEGIFDSITNIFSPEIVSDEEAKRRIAEKTLYPPVRRDPSELLYLTGLGRLRGIGAGALKDFGKYPQVLDQYKRYVSGIKDPFIGAEQGGYNAMIPNVPSTVTRPGMFTNAAIKEAVAPYISGARELASSGAGKVLDLAKEYGLAIAGAGGLGYGAYKGLGLGDNKQSGNNNGSNDNNTMASEMDKLRQLYKKQIEDMQKAHQEELAKLKGAGATTSGESDISQYAKEARDLLGYDEAKKQSIYDALLAASPGFFKGRTLTEAAPNILESINKSGAFEKPTNIKQAAAQLAIQRKMLQEKAIAEEKTRYGLLEAREGYKSKDPLERLKALGGDPSTSWGGDLPSKTELLESGKFYKDAQGRLLKAVQDQKTKTFSLINYG